MQDTTSPESVTQAIPDGGIPRPDPSDPVARDRLTGEYAVEWNRQVEWRMHIREYAAQMLGVVSGNPCTDGVNDWLQDRGMPRLRRLPTGHYGVGDESEARRAVRLNMSSSDPTTLNGLSDLRVATRLEALRRTGSQWRTDFMRMLWEARENYPRIPHSMVEELQNRLGDVPVPVPAPADPTAQGATFPVPVESAPPVPTTVTINVAVMMRLDVTGERGLAALSDADMGAFVRERVQNTLRRSVLVRASGVRAGEDDITVLTGVIRSQPSA